MAAERSAAWRFPTALVPARFCCRPNRFVAVVDTEAGPLRLHLPTTGRLGELLLPGRRVWYTEGAGPKTDGRLVAVGEGRLVAVDAVLAEVWAEAFQLRGAVARRGVRSGGHRFDFLLRDDTLVEVKGVTLYEGDTALFPDAPTARGRSQVEALTELAAGGRPTWLLFVLMGGRASRLRFHGAHDPGFARAVAKASAAGVKVSAMAVDVDVVGARCSGAVPVDLAAGGEGSGR